VPIAVSILEPHVEAARAAADRLEPAADLLEFRVDGMERFDAPALLAGRRKGVIVACPRGDAGGRYLGSAEECLDRLRRAAEAGASWVDVDWRLADRLTDLPGRCRRIISFHRAEGLPEDPVGVMGFLRSLAAEGDLVKFVPRVSTLEGALTLARWCVDGGGRVLAFATGPAALVSRILALAGGAPFVYAAPAAGKETADGQPSLAELRAALPPRAGAASTAIFGVVGRPVGHSLSPLVHTIALRLLGFDAVFMGFEPREFGPFWDLAEKLPFFRGFAVTAPFKEEALRRSDRADDGARHAVAANTLVRGEAGWRALNTDDDGAADALELGLGAKLLGRKVVILGTGGAARAVAAGVRRRGADPFIAGRNAAKAKKLASHLSAEAIPWESVGEVPYDVLVNATPVGQWPGPAESPVAADAIRPGSLVMDAVVRPLETELGRLAKSRGAQFLPGVNWFLLQAARQVRLFTGSEAPLPQMRAAALEALRRDPKPLLGVIPGGEGEP
jgi:3-dehydroquinate dehydratase/shikimate dehydrogenase